MRRFLIPALILAAGLVTLSPGGPAAQIGRTAVLLHDGVDPTGTVTNSSAVIVDGAKDFVEVQYILTTLTSTNIVFTADCRLRGASTWVTLNTTTRTSTGDSNYSYAAHCYEVRVGVKSTADAAGDVVSVRLDYR